MKSENKSSKWYPEIMYREVPEDYSGMNIPLVPVPDGEDMPSCLFLFESRTSTGMDEETRDACHYGELTLHCYCNMSTLRKNLDPETYSKVRTVLGLDPTPGSQELLEREILNK
jgi:hypothetical protein